MFGCLGEAGDTVLDLGANIGWYSVLAAKLVGETGRVWAFEPDAANAIILSVNAAVSDPHGVIELVQAAVSDTGTEATLYRSPSNLGDHRLFSDGSARDVHIVNVTTLDAFFIGQNRQLPNLVKCDTQGSEANILRGATELFLKGWRPTMILEFWPFGLTQSGADPMELWRLLVTLGYEMFEVSEPNPKLFTISDESIIFSLADRISPSSQNFINLLCIPTGSPKFSNVRHLVEIF